MQPIAHKVRILVTLSVFLLALVPIAKQAAGEDRTAWSSAQSGSGQLANEIAAPTIKVYSRETVVDVTVTDKNGKPVRGLTRADFTVTEDDKPQSIRSFSEFDNTMSGEVSAPPKLPPNTYSNVSTATGPLYVVLDGARWSAQLISNLGPRARVVLLGGGGRLTVLRSANEPALRPGMVIGINPIKTSPGLTGCSLRIALDWKTLDELNQLAAYLSGIPGKKNLIWVGGDTSDLTWNNCQVWNGPLRQTYDLLQDAQVTVYPVDPIGIRVPGVELLATPTIGGTGKEMEEAGWLGDPRVTHLSMEAVAEATGGQAFYNTNDILGALAQAGDAGSSYYTLSYTAPGVGYDGRYHSISIKVNRPDLRLLYHKGYSAEDPALIEHPPETLLGVVTRDTRPAGAAADPLVAAMTLTEPPATQFPFDVRVEPSTEPVKPTDPAVMGFLDVKLKNAPLTRYGFQYTLPVDAIASGDESGAARTRTLELVIVAYDWNGNVVSSLHQAIDATAPDQTAREPLHYLLQIDLPPGRMHVRVGVRDKGSNKVGTVEIPLLVGKGAAVAASR